MPVKTMARAEAIGGGDYVCVTHGAAGLNDGGGAGLGGFFHAIGETGRTRRRRRRYPCNGDCAFITAILTESTRLIWPGADTESSAIASEDDGVGFYVLGRPSRRSACCAFLPGWGHAW